MKRRTLLRNLTAALAGGLLPGALRAGGDEPLGALRLPGSHWKALVSEPAWKVLVEEDTERSGSSALNHEKREGTFHCAACYQPLFSSKAKFDSGTGWPSFWQPLPKAIATKTDYKIVFPRTEYHCARCGGHQGHVFDDGPPPTGQRYCNNGLALHFVPAGEATPELRS